MEILGNEEVSFALPSSRIYVESEMEGHRKGDSSLNQET